MMTEMQSSKRFEDNAVPVEALSSDIPIASRRLANLFPGHQKASGTHGMPTQKLDSLKWEIKTTAQTVREPADEEKWRSHLEGKRALGVIPICSDGTCQWGSIDYDVYDTNLLDVIERVERHKLPLLPCRSKSGGLHLFLFLAEPYPAAQVQEVLRDATP